jgi:PadR family transcriptional regulator, regulatory protein PadR
MVPMDQGDLLRGHLDRLLLAVLVEAPGHGYELVQRLGRRSDQQLDVPEGSLYPALHRLERAGLVSSVWDDTSGRRRRVYSLTRAGRRQLEGWRREWTMFSGAVDRVLGVAR